MTMNWAGVMPAITTCFDENLEIDHGFTAKHVKWLVENGCTGIVTNGSLGEGGALSLDEKIALWKTCVSAVGDRVPIVAAIASMTTEDAAIQAKAARDAGCAGLMVLPPYIYRGDTREMKAHITAVCAATDLSCMLYNNPVAYGTDFLPEHVAEMANEIPNLHAVKESSTDVRRITAIRALTGDRLRIFVGVDDVIVEGIAAGYQARLRCAHRLRPRPAVADLGGFVLRPLRRQGRAPASRPGSSARPPRKHVQ